MSALTKYDCQSCGACCVQFGPHDGNAYVYLDRQEARQMRSLGLPVIEQSMGSSWLTAEAHEGSGGRVACVAFIGRLGDSCGCSIYADRPGICRTFEVGEQLCKEAREQAGLWV